MSWCFHSSTRIVHLFLTFHPLLLTHFIFLLQGLNASEIDCPQPVTLHAFSNLGLVASLKLRWLISVEVSSANHAHSSQARRDSGQMNPISPHGYAGGNEKNQVSLSLRWALKTPTRKTNWWILLRCLAEAHWLEDDVQHHRHIFLLNCRCR
jgi:hypothetical protein